MDNKREAFRRRLLATFREEAAEHIRTLSSGLIELEKPSATESRPRMLETIFREAHSLKGAARAVNVQSIETVCQALEDMFSSWQRKNSTPDAAHFDVLHRATDFLERVLLTLDDEKGEARAHDVKPVVAGLRKLLEGRSEPEGEQTAAPQSEASKDQLATKHDPRGAIKDTVRLPSARVGALLLEAEELLTAKQAAHQRAGEVDQLLATLAPWKKTRAQMRIVLRTLQQPDATRDLRPDAEHGNGRQHAVIGKLVSLQEEDDRLFHAMESRIEALRKAELRDTRSLERMIDQLLDTAKRVVMLPASTMLETFPRLARDLARDRGKQLELELLGSEIEVDRRILDEMKEPLLHLVRNAVDHGIESPAERRIARKPEVGVITISLSRKDSDKVELVVSDDGRGVHVEKVRAAATRMGLGLSAETEDSEAQEAQAGLNLIFRSGVSTSPIITDISGRGLGLAIVQEKVETLGGTVSVENRPGLGIAFRMTLPLTRAVFRGVLVRAEEHLFVLPSVHVERVIRFQESEVKTVENRETLVIEGRTTALVKLTDALGLKIRESSPAGKAIHAVVIGPRERRIAIRVDEVLDEQEILAKTLGRQLIRVRNVSGATVFSDGRVVPILDVADLLQSAVAAGEMARQPAVSDGQPERIKKSILVAEDSITARALLRNILETAGYDVQTAVDGAEAFASLKTGSFDLLVSDVDMPRLNGFGLAQKVRSDAQLKALPVVLVTALGTREDRERGIDSGANAYSVKSSFDESNLLEVVRRLL